MCAFCANPADFLPVSGLALGSDRLILATPRADQAAAMLDFVTSNRQHLKAWTPPEPPHFYTLPHWQEAIARYALAFDNGVAVRFWLSPRERPHRVIGSVGFSQLFRGPFCSCVLGYQIDREHQGQGLMSEAVRVAMRYMFEEQKLHRIAANYRPDNVRSGRLLATLGFRIDGYAKDYLFIDGAWRDHILASVTNAAFDPGWIR
jgi:ribosomal-protein-alanine N-acetyltransferase